MREPCEAKPHLENCETAIKDLKTALETASLQDMELLAVVSEVTVASILVQINMTVEKIYEAVYELSILAHFKKVESKVSPEKPHLLHRGIVNPVVDGDGGGDDHVEIIVQDLNTDSPENNKSNGAQKGASCK